MDLIKEPYLKFSNCFRWTAAAAGPREDCLTNVYPISPSQRTPYLDPAAGVDDERHSLVLLRVRPRQVSDGCHISLGVPLWRQVAYVVGPGRRLWMHVGHAVHRAPYVCQRHQACTAAPSYIQEINQFKKSARAKRHRLLH